MLAQTGANPLLRRLKLALVTGLVFFLLGWGGIAVWGGNAHSASPIWPATAFGICIILRLSRSRGDDFAMLAAMLPAGILANWMGGAPWAMTIGFSLINLLDMMAGLVATRHFAPSRITTMRSAARFALAFETLSFR